MDLFNNEFANSGFCEGWNVQRWMENSFSPLQPEIILENISVSPSLGCVKIDEDQFTECVASLKDSQIQPRSKAGRKPLNTGLKLRKDVVLKTILRKIRTFYWSDFNEITRFKVYKHRKEEDFYETCLKRYITTRLGIECSPEYLFALGSFMSSRDVEKLLATKTSLLYTLDPNRRNEMIKGNDEVHETLYKFSFSKYQKLVRNKYFKDLIIGYSNAGES